MDDWMDGWMQCPSLVSSRDRRATLWPSPSLIARTLLQCRRICPTCGGARKRVAFVHRSTQSRRVHVSHRIVGERENDRRWRRERRPADRRSRACSRLASSRRLLTGQERAYYHIEMDGQIGGHEVMSFTTPTVGLQSAPSSSPHLSHLWGVKRFDHLASSVTLGG